MLPLLVVIFIVVPLAELYVIIQVGQAIGALWTVVLLLADSILGSLLMRSQGRAVWRRFRLALEEGRVPARETLDGAMVIFGGAFLVTPGFISDVVGAVLLVPPTRALVRRVLVRRFSRRFVITPFGTSGSARRRGPHGPARPGDFVEGTATDLDRERLP